ncbi:hypothetical protein [Stenotrophomonas maltophilia]|uniref:Uncharacterized protein n=1 Tax=Stenotrophomonas maltophilia TaxID=40324 RepID=A0A2W6JZE4_STEMA|nr:hypothetical protein [Stenotrophomonas maltophilia]PZS88132.1 hypothetical protein A7X83_15545 [Stenotrophomonas maltophilia]
MALDPSISIIRGLQASVALNGLTVSVTPGMCYVPGTGRILSDGAATVTLSSPTPNTFYHLYGYDAGGGVMALEASTTAPDTPYLGSARCKTGDPTRRYLISGRTNASGVLRPGRHTRPGEMGNRVMLDAASAAGSVPVMLLSGLVATTPQTIDLSSVIPVTATRAIIQILNPTNFSLYVARSDVGAPSATNFQWVALPGSSPACDVTLDANRQFTVLLNASLPLIGPILGILTGSVSITLVGYEFDR